VAETRTKKERDAEQNRPPQHMMSGLLIRLATALFLLCVNVAAFADPTTATVRVRIIDATAASTATVEVVRDDDIRRAWTVSTSPSGTATIPGLPPGTYTISVRFGGGAADVSTKVSLAPGVIVSMEASTMPHARLAVVDSTTTAAGSEFRASDVQALPVGSDVWALVETAAPFVIVDRLGSSGGALGTTPAVGTRGASWTRMTMRLGDAEIARAPGTGAMTLYPLMSMAETVRVASASSSADLGAEGASLILVPHRPARTRAGALDLAFSNAGMAAINERAGAPSVIRPDGWKQAEASWGGPAGDRAGVFVSAGALHSDTVEGRRQLPSTADVGSALSHAVFAASPHDEVRWLALAQRVRRPYPGRIQFQNPNVSETDVFVHTQGAWDHVTGNGRRLALSASFEHGTFDPDALTSGLAAIDRAIDGVMPPLAADGSLQQFGMHAEVQFQERRRHAVIAGLEAGRLHASSRGLNPIASSPSADPATWRGELVAGLPARIWVPAVAAAESVRTVSRVQGYLEDRYAWSDHATIDLGARFGTSGGSAEGAAQTIGWGLWEPRVSLRWALPDTALTIGYRRYQPALTLDPLAFGDPGEARFDVYRWNDQNQDGQVAANERGALVARAGRAPGMASIDTRLHAPSSHELMLGVERALGGHMRVNAAAVVRREGSLVRSVNTGAPVSSYQTVLVPDRGEDWDSARDDRLLAVYDRLPSSFGNDAYLLTNSTGEHVSYDGLEIGWTFAAARTQSTAGISAYLARGSGANRGFRANENDQGVIGEIFENPNASSYSEGRLFFDRAYTAKWVTAYRAPGDVLLSLVARYQDGQPFSRLVVAPNLAQGPELVTAYPAGRTRFTYTLTTDVRVEKRLTFSGWHASIRVDVFNVPNLASEVEENVLTGPAFRDSVLVQPPRNVRVGLKFEF